MHTQEQTQGWRTSRHWKVLFWPVFVTGMLVFVALCAWVGGLNQDEGWYLYAGRLVAEGQMPYRDFASTQGPLMSYVYAMIWPLVAVGGILAGRVFTAGLAVATLGLVMLQARRMTKRSQPLMRRAAVLACGFLGLNLYHVYFTTIVKTYALAGLLVMAALIVLDTGWRRMQEAVQAQQRVEVAWIGILGAGGGILLAGAASTRLSAGILLPAWWLTLLVRGWNLRYTRPYWFLLGGMVIGGTIGLTVLLGPFLLLAPEGMRFGLLDYHAGRSAGSGLEVAVYKLGFLLRWVRGYAPLLMMGVLAWLLPSVSPARTGRQDRDAKQDVAAWLVGLGVVAVTLVHISAAFPYDDYQVFIMPLLAVWVGSQLAQQLERWQAHASVLTVALLLLLALGSVSSPLLQNWMLADRDRIWWPLRTESQMGQLRRVADTLRDMPHTGDTSLLLTQDTYLAVEAGMRVPAGWELGPFCYFPDLSDAKAAKCHVMNRARMIETLHQTDAAYAAFSGYGFAIAAPGVVPLAPADAERFWHIINERYTWIAQWEGFGQAATTLQMYEKREMNAKNE